MKIEVFSADAIQGALEDDGYLCSVEKAKEIAVEISKHLEETGDEIYTSEGWVLSSADKKDDYSHKVSINVKVRHWFNEPSAEYTSHFQELQQIYISEI